MLYRRLLRPALFRLDAEDAHHLTLRGLESGAAAKVLGTLYGVPNDPRLCIDLFGLAFPSPVGLAAGLDKDARAVAAFSRLGLGFVEVGTVTPRPQPGNPRPRLFRLPEDGALINRMGFNNAGMHAAAGRLEKLAARPVPIAVNIGKNKETPNEAAADDYRACVRTLFPYADLFVVNVSSPNTPGLRALQGAEELGTLLGAVLAEVETLRVRYLKTAPVLVKIAPDLDGAALEATVGAAVDAGVAGIIVANTTLGRDGLTQPHRGEAGGLSGKPLAARSTELVRRAYALTGGRLPIVASGGVFTGRDAYEKIRAGASLVELYTGLIYQGPSLPGRINRELSGLLERDGFESVARAVGMGRSSP